MSSCGCHVGFRDAAACDLERCIVILPRSYAGRSNGGPTQRDRAPPVRWRSRPRQHPRLPLRQVGPVFTAQSGRGPHLSLAETPGGVPGLGVQPLNARHVEIWTRVGCKLSKRWRKAFLFFADAIFVFVRVHESRTFTSICNKSGPILMQVETVPAKQEAPAQDVEEVVVKAETPAAVADEAKVEEEAAQPATEVVESEEKPAEEEKAEEVVVAEEVTEETKPETDLAAPDATPEETTAPATEETAESPEAAVEEEEAAPTVLEETKAEEETPAASV
ncbi:hypothetical protein GW17_00008451 [Ensete ventricosum]|nr:hypothetical protein GW17_00008451 [Ensete ventricosum]